MTVIPVRDLLFTLHSCCCCCFIYVNILKYFIKLLFSIVLYYLILLRQLKTYLKC